MSSETIEKTAIDAPSKLRHGVRQLLEFIYPDKASDELVQTVINAFYGAIPVTYIQMLVRLC